ncbi:hypothetical protein G7054_g9974 [Neopestalotiopsis clavispora]|nr:hypothetical protein G7054_g9974 [Neopestalotiopsis clavispora]
MKISATVIVRCLAIFLPHVEGKKCSDSYLISPIVQSTTLSSSSCTQSTNAALSTTTAISLAIDPTVWESTIQVSIVTESVSLDSSTMTPLDGVVQSTSHVGPMVTNQAYIDTVLRHHNVHRANHSGRHTGVGQNIGAGIPADAMGVLITEGFYNNEVNAYKAYGMEPNDTDAGHHVWGHFSQVIWESTTTVGCYTQDCSVTGLNRTNESTIAPWFSICNYFPPGNVAPLYGANVRAGTGKPTVFADFMCPDSTNCENRTE